MIMNSTATYTSPHTVWMCRFTTYWCIAKCK